MTTQNVYTKKTALNRKKKVSPQRHGHSLYEKKIILLTTIKTIIKTRPNNFVNVSITR